MRINSEKMVGLNLVMIFAQLILVTYFFSVEMFQLYQSPSTYVLKLAMNLTDTIPLLMIFIISIYSLITD